MTENNYFAHNLKTTMKQLVLFLSFLICVNTIHAQKKDNDPKNAEKPVEFSIDSSRVLTLDKTIKTLYRSISGGKGEKRNWKQFKYLFKPDAKLIPSGINKLGHYMVNYMSPDDYIKNSGSWLEDNGFIEKEIHREIDAFGNIAHVFSTYEAYLTHDQKTPFMRGINSIQLQFDGKRWWIVNIFWTQETKYNPIPKTYLPNNY